jgi:hypothetical protein
MTMVLVAAVAAPLAVISVPAFSAQKENVCPRGNCTGPPHPPGPPHGRTSRTPSQQQPVDVGPLIYVDPQRLCVVSGGVPFGMHDVTGRSVCRVFAVPGSYCECADGFGGVLGGIVE